MTRKIMDSGDGKSARTAYHAPRILWEYTILAGLGLRFQTQRLERGPEGNADVITAFNPKTKSTTDVWFRVAPDPELEATAKEKYDEDAEDNIRQIARSGDGLSPDTAFVVGGDIPMEYTLLYAMGLKSEMQALVMIGGCGFDVQSAKAPESNITEQIYFNIGRGPLHYDRNCVANTKSRGSK